MDSAGKKHKVTVLLDDLEFDRLCAYCIEQGHKKSTLIAKLLRDYLDREGFAAADAGGRTETPNNGAGVSR